MKANLYKEIYQEILFNINVLLEAHALEKLEYGRYLNLQKQIVNSYSTLDNYGQIKKREGYLFYWCIGHTSKHCDRLLVSLEIKKDDPNNCYMCFNHNEETRLSTNTDFNAFIIYRTGYTKMELKWDIR
jgi:hypothetical protein